MLHLKLKKNITLAFLRRCPGENHVMKGEVAHHFISFPEAVEHRVDKSGLRKP